LQIHMTIIHPAYLAHERQRFMRPDAHRFIRSDWRRFVTPGSELAADYERIERKYRPDQARVPAGSREGGQWTDGDGSADAASGSSDRVRTAGSVIPICVIGEKSLYGDGTNKVVYVCADGREIVREGVGRSPPGVIRQPPR
jgi:hypothetical protein